MRLVFMLTILVCYVNYSSTAIYEMKELTKSLRKDEKILSGDIKVAQKIILSLEGYESGSAVNAPGEIVNLVQAFDQILPIFRQLSTMLHGLANILIGGLSVSTGTGVFINIPNVMIVPYTKMIPSALADLDKLIGFFQQAEGVIKNQVVPLFSEESFNSAGSLPIPASAVNTILNELHSGITMVITILTNANEAAKASQAAEPKGLSIKASTAMNTINKAIINAAKSTIPNIEDAAKEIGTIKITDLGNGYDKLNLKQIVILLNKTLSNIYTFLTGADKELGTLVNLLGLVNNPIGGFFFNII